MFEFYKLNIQISSHHQNTQYNRIKKLKPGLHLLSHDFPYSATTDFFSFIFVCNIASPAIITSITFSNILYYIILYYIILYYIILYYIILYYIILYYIILYYIILYYIILYYIILYYIILYYIPMWKYNMAR